MADTGFILPQSVQEVTGTDVEPWTNPTNLTTDSQATVAYNDLPKQDYSDFLIGYNYDLSSIPSDATIDGIEIQIEHRGEENLQDAVVSLYQNTTPVGDDKSTDVNIGTVWGTRTYGGAADTWSAGLSVADLQTSTFGVGVQYYNYITANQSRWVEVNTIRIKVHYHTGGTDVTTVDTGVTGTLTVNAPLVHLFDHINTTQLDPFEDGSGGWGLSWDRDSSFSLDEVYHGTDENITYVDGHLGRAASFNGTSSRITSADNIMFTRTYLKGVSFHIKPNDITTEQYIFSEGADTGVSNAPWFSIVITAEGKISVRYHSPSGIGTFGISAISLVQGEWNHVVCNTSGVVDTLAGFNVYINGDSTGATGNEGVSDGYSFGKWHIGENSGVATGGWFDGELDQFRAFTKQLSQTEVYMLQLEKYQALSPNYTIEADVSTGTLTPQTILLAGQLFDIESDDTDSFGDASDIAGYNFDTNLNDFIGSYNATAIGSIIHTTGDGGHLDEAVSISSVDAAIDLNMDALAIGDIGAVSTWVYWEEASVTNILFDFNDASDKSWFYAFISSGVVYVRSYDSAGALASTLASNRTVPGSGWHLVTINMLDSATPTNEFEIYIDGYRADDADGSYSTSTIAGGSTLLGNNTFFSYTWVPSLKFDQTRFFNKRLIPEEVYSLYNETLATGGTDVTIIETGVTGTFTSNAVTITTTSNATVVDSGITGTFSVNDVTVVTETIVNVTVVDTGVTGTLTSNAATVSAIQNITTIDTGVVGTFVAEDVIVSGTQNIAIADAGVIGTFSAEGVTVTTIQNATVVDTGSSLLATVNDVVVSVSQNATIVDTGVTGTFVVNNVIVAVGGSITVADTGVTATFSVNEVVVVAEIIANVTIVDTGITGTFTVNEPTVSAIRNVNIIDIGQIATFVPRDVIVDATKNITIIDTGSAATFTVNNVTVSTRLDVAVVDAGVIGTFTVNDVDVTIDVTVLDNGVTGIFTVNDVTIYLQNNALILDTGSVLSITANEVNVVTLDSSMVGLLEDAINRLQAAPSANAIEIWNTDLPLEAYVPPVVTGDTILNRLDDAINDMPYSTAYEAWDKILPDVNTYITDDEANYFVDEDGNILTA